MLEAILFCGLVLGVVAIILNLSPVIKPEINETPRERRIREANHSVKYKG